MTRVVLTASARRSPGVEGVAPVEYRVLRLDRVLDYLDARDAQRRRNLDKIAEMSAQEEMDS